MNDIFQGYGVEVRLPDEDAFLKIKETLTRIGILSRKTKTLYQSCHILHKQGKYAIVHFKELLELDGKTSNKTQEDLDRRNTIARLLEDWQLLRIAHPELITTNPVANIKVLTFSEKETHTLVSKYSFNKRNY